MNMGLENNDGFQGLPVMFKFHTYKMIGQVSTVILTYLFDLYITHW